MRKMMALAALVFCLPVHASEGFNGSAALKSNYIWRGVTQTSDRPSVEGDLYYEFKGGPYVGQTFGAVHYSNDDPAYLESATYLGMSHSIFTEDLTLDVRASQYIYPAAHNHDYPEMHFALTWKDVTASFDYTDDYFHTGISGYYTELAVNHDFPKDWSIGASAGYFVKDDVEGNYWNGKVYVNKKIKGVKFELALTSTFKRHHEEGDTAGNTKAVFSISKDFA